MNALPKCRIVIWPTPTPGLRRACAQPITESAIGPWVLTHPDVRRATRVRAFARFIAEAFLADRTFIEGRRPATA